MVVKGILAMGIIKKEASDLLILLVLFLIVSFFIFNHLGVKNVTDSARYLDYARNLEDGFYIEKHNFWYIGYVILIFIVHALTGSYNELNLILFQYLYSLFGLVFLYKTIKIFHGTTPAPLIGGVLFLVFIEISIWNSYILCESFYFNNIVFTFYFLAKTFIQKKFTVTNIALSVFFTILTTFSKPTGIVIILSIASTAYLYFWLHSKWHLRIKIITFFLVYFMIGYLINMMIETFQIIENYQFGEIIYNILSLPQKAEYNSLTHTVPELNLLPPQFPPLIRLIHFIFFNFEFWCILFLKKIYFFLMHIRPYWSLKHNLYNIIILLPINILALWQIVITNNFVKFFILIYLVLHILIVGITTVDWDGRFFLPLIPIIIIFAAQRIYILNASLKHYISLKL